MTNTLAISPATLREIFYEFSMASERPDAALLDEFVRRYPAHAAELTNFAIERVLDSAFADRAEDSKLVATEENQAVSKAMSRFYNRLYAVQNGVLETKSAVPQVNPFASLDRPRSREFCASMRINNVFLMKMRDRLIEAGTMTVGFQKRVAVELPAALELVMAHFSGPPQLEARASYKADDKPAVGAKQTFGDAVRQSGLSQEQQDFLLSL